MGSPTEEPLRPSTLGQEHREGASQLEPMSTRCDLKEDIQGPKQGVGHFHPMGSLLFCCEPDLGRPEGAWAHLCQRQGPLPRWTAPPRAGSTDRPGLTRLSAPRASLNEPTSSAQNLSKEASRFADKEAEAENPAVRNTAELALGPVLGPQGWAVTTCAESTRAVSHGAHEPGWTPSEVDCEILIGVCA